MNADIVTIPDHTERDNASGVHWLKAAPVEYFAEIPRAYAGAISGNITFEAGKAWHDITGIFDSFTFAEDYKEVKDGHEYKWTIRLKNGKKSLLFDQAINSLKQRKLIVLLMLMNENEYPLLVGDTDNWLIFEQKFDSKEPGAGGSLYDHSIGGTSRIPAYHYLGEY